MKKSLVMLFMVSLLILNTPMTQAQGYERGYNAGYDQAYDQAYRDGYNDYERQSRDREVKSTLRDAALGAGAGYFFSGHGHKVGNSLLGGGIGAAFSLLK
ncbi:MAG: hypothetical protein AB7V50_03620 [Vampirovibrionia bacterium]